MTLGYVERSYRLPPHSLGPLLGIASGSGAGHRSLADLAEARGQSLDDFLADLTAALDSAR